MAHGIHLSHHHLKRIGKHAHNLQRRLERVSAKTERALDEIIDTGLTVGAGVALGFVHGRFGPTEVQGIPMELVGGGAAIGLSVLGVGGRHSDKLGALGRGLLTPYAYNLAKGVGMDFLGKSNDKRLPTGAQVTGRLPTQALTPEERAVIREPVSVQR